MLKKIRNKIIIKKVLKKMKIDFDIFCYVNKYKKYHMLYDSYINNIYISFYCEKNDEKIVYKRFSFTKEEIINLDEVVLYKNFLKDLFGSFKNE